MFDKLSSPGKRKRKKCWIDPGRQYATQTTIAILGMPQPSSNVWPASASQLHCNPISIQGDSLSSQKDMSLTTDMFLIKIHH
ncbi:hypothetical protein DSO57_1039148 [Entomophthora muscae]|uniref:Uncharacterized protein n=1 Tax=Entomophthora muscae TaxID=34485 RepID=A0ACC2RD70_9FUNG|nr:hypothetical protein DSO57_1039148 [Entomophthora muscae]